MRRLPDRGDLFLDTPVSFSEPRLLRFEPTIFRIALAVRGEITNRRRLTRLAEEPSLRVTAPTFKSDGLTATVGFYLITSHSRRNMES